MQGRVAETVAVAIVLLCGVEVAGAAALRVPEDYPTIYEAVDAAVAGDSVLVAAGTWTDTDTRVIWGTTNTCAAFLKADIAVLGAGPDQTIVDARETGAGYVSPFLFTDDPGEVVLEGMTVTGAAAGGAGVAAWLAGRVVVRNCRVSGNDDPMCAGAIRLDTCDLLLEDSEVSFNTGVLGVAGVHASSLSAIEVYRCRFEGNAGRSIRVENNYDNDNIIVVDCEFVNNRITGGSGAACSISDPRTVQIERNLFLRNVNTGGTGAGLWVGHCWGTIANNVFAYDSTYGGYNAAGLFMSNYTGSVTGNTFVGCHMDPPYDGAAISFGSSSSLTTFANNVIAGCTGSGAIWIQVGESPMGACNGFWNNEGGLGDYVPDATDLFLDPQFCDPPSLDFSLAESSPYLAANNPSCGRIGALGEGCGPVSVESRSWGRIKQMYR